jgi:hypothetical protein
VCGRTAAGLGALCPSRVALLEQLRDGMPGRCAAGCDLQGSALQPIAERPAEAARLRPSGGTECVSVPLQLGAPAAQEQQLGLSCGGRLGEVGCQHRARCHQPRNDILCR